MLPRRWYTAGGNPHLWPRTGTYTPIAWEDLPPLDGAVLDGTFDWLAAQPVTEGVYFDRLDHQLDAWQREEQRVERVAAIIRSARAQGLTVPPSFGTFFADGDRTYHRLPTCTACCLDLGDRLTPIEGEPGGFLRFMNDQQCILVWGLHLRPDGKHQVVTARPDFHDEASGDTLEDQATFTGHEVCADDFEEFVYRFWLENALWYEAQRGMTNATPEMLAYVAHVQERLRTRESAR